MAQRKTAAAGKRPAARGEKKKTDRTVKFRGLDLSLPPALGSEVAFDYVELIEGEVAILPGSIRIVRSILGEEQWRSIRAKLASDGVEMEQLNEVLTELIKLVFGKYDLTAGK